jgi:hypothetical protein
MLAPKAIAPSPVPELEHRDGDRQQEQRRRRVADPHAEERGAPQEAGDQAPRCGAQRRDDRQREPAMEPPPLHRGGHQEPAQEQKDQRVGIRRRGLLDRAHAEEREEG